MKSSFYSVSFSGKILHFLDSWPYLYTFSLSVISFQNLYSFVMPAPFGKITYFSFYFLSIREPNINLPTNLGW